VSTIPVPRGPGRRAVLGTLALAAVGTPLALTQQWASAGTTDARPLAAALLWSPSPSSDGLKAFEGIEADRAHLHPGRKYIYVEGDHYRFDIYRDDRDSTGGGDRQRTEAKGMVAGGSALKMRNNETWRITYELFMPTTLHGTSKFSASSDIIDTHLFIRKYKAYRGT
jgi:hypothetical protein